VRAVKGNKDRDDCQLETLQFVQSKPLLTQQPKNLTTHNLCKGTQPTNLLAPLKVENSITNFEKQLRMVSTPKKSTDFIIMPIDKNLSPAIMNRDEYIKKILLSTF